MTPAEFKRKWHRYQGKESSAYQEHFSDLCRLFGQPTPAEADPTGSESFCFQKRVVKDAELLFELREEPEPAEPSERGFADVWKKGCFAWEYKGKKKNLDDAYKQLLRYRESLLNPPLLVVCDFDRYIVRTNFNGTVQEVYEFTNDQVDRPEHLKILRAVFSDPDYLKPQRTTAQVTENLAKTIAEVARSLQEREAVELADATSRAEMSFAQRKNLRIARFLNRIVFCFFAEDTGLLPKKLFSELLKTGVDDLHHFAETLEKLFKVMAKGGIFGKDKIRHFNGHLFEESTVFELTEDELRKLADASLADWQFIQPGIMGTLFERALDFEEGGKLRAQLGAHYTSETDIKTLVEPVLMAPLRREWAALKGELATAYAKGKGNPAQRDKLAAFQKKLAAIKVLDPACGSGNFLYVSLQLLLDLEKEVVTYAMQLGFKLAPQVSVQQLKAIEINPYAFELAQVSVQIGFLQWRRDNGFDNDRSPVLQELDGFQNEDALLVPHFRSKARTLKEAQAGEHKRDEALKFYTERDWPKCDVIVSNPPFLHSSKLLRELGQNYRARLFEVFEHRVPGFADLCCYWFEKARQQIENGKCKRAGLLATQSIRRELDGRRVSSINPNLSAAANITEAKPLKGHDELWAYGSQQKAPFDIDEDLALEMLAHPNPGVLPNSDVVRPSYNATQFLRRTKLTWVVDFGVEKDSSKVSRYEMPFEFCRNTIFPKRQYHREPIQRNCWWMHARPSPAYRAFAAASSELLVTPAVSKHRVFAFVDSAAVPDHALIVFQRSDMHFFGVLQSRLQETWARAQATQVRERESGLRYTPSVCFETFPFPRPTPAQEAAVAAAAKELNELRERWLNPPEWTVEKVLEFPGSVGGPWDRYIDPSTINPQQSTGLVRYPRLEPRDAECAARLKKRTLTNLYNERPAWLDLAHKKLDAAVAASYGWPADLTDEKILEKLLALNLERATEEAKAAREKKPKLQRGRRADELV